MDMQTYAEDLIQRIDTQGWAGVKDDIHAVNLPAGWEQFIAGLFDNLKDQDLTTGIKAVADMTRAELSWPEGELPSPLDQVTHVVAAGYETGEEGSGDWEKASFTFPILEIDGEWKLILAN